MLVAVPWSGVWGGGLEYKLFYLFPKYRERYRDLTF